MIHGNGDIFLIYFEHEADRFCFVVMQSDIANFDKFKNSLAKGEFYDWETPYGYGGPLADTGISETTQELFKKEITEYCMEKRIVSLFVRFHPLLKNFEVLPEVFETRYLRDTIAIDTADVDIILSNMESGNRNKVRKAVKRGVSIEVKPIEEYKDFVVMYNETMKKHSADDFYIFGEDYFRYQSELKDCANIFYAVYEDMPICGAIMYYNDRYMHYHLGGSKTEYRNNFPNNLLFYEAACWASRRGITKLHLGGGMSPDDSLFGFKKQFNKNGRHPFVVGRIIFDLKAYDKLLSIRKENDSRFDMENGFMIQYRR